MLAKVLTGAVVGLDGAPVEVAYRVVDLVAIQALAGGAGSLARERGSEGGGC
jgi:hypothetical protein